MKSLLFAVIATFVSLPLFSAQQNVLIAEKGKTACRIVVPEGASKAHRRAAEELAKYLALAASAPAPEISSVPEKGTIPFRLELSEGEFKDKDSFRLTVSPKEVKITAGNEQSLYYGVYRFLKKYAKMRWLVPGTDGEYYTPGTRIAPPVQDTLETPSFPYRKLEFNCANTSERMEAMQDWILRNNFVHSGVFGHVYTTKAWKPELGASLQLRAARVSDSKMFGGILSGARIRPEVKSESGELKKLFSEHPDYFPLVEGKRIIMRGYEQPCTSNQGVIDRMGNHVTIWSKTLSSVPDARFAVINEDGTTWCSCAKCLALDPPGEKKNNYRSTRYWLLLNQIFRESMEKYPDVKMAGLAYQNFQTVPTGVKIDERIQVGLSFNRRCFRHKLDDPKCQTNKIFLEYYKEWGKLPNETYSREEYHAGVGQCFMPSERNLVAGFKNYKELGIDGAAICTTPPDGVYRPFYGDTVKLGWFCEWQALYLAGEVLWDIETDTEKLLEEANSLYYGKGWHAGMKEFRELLTKACAETPGCYGWGHGSHPGRVLAKVGLPEKLSALLEQAEKAAASDPRALAHIKREKYLFHLTLLKSVKEFLRSYKELKSFETASPVKIDANPSEQGWKDAELYTSFIRFKGDKTLGENQTAEVQTFVKTFYDRDNLYCFIEAMEPNPIGVIATKKKGEAPWGDDSLELFLTHPNFNGGYYHFAFTCKGAFYQAQTQPGSLQANPAIDTGIEIVSQSLPDRWRAEIRIPVAKLGQDCETGHTWQINVARNRNNAKGKEQSSLTGGFHGSWLPLSLAGKRETGNAGVKDTRLWKNGSFNDVFKRPNAKWCKGWNLGKDELLPRDWSLNTPWENGSDLEILKHPGSDTDYYLRLKNGNIYQRHLGKDTKVRFTFRAKGNTDAKVMVFRFDRGKYPKHLGSDNIISLKLNSNEWKTFSKDYVKKNPEETVSLVFWNKGNGDLFIDDAYCFGIDTEKEKKTDEKK